MKFLTETLMLLFGTLLESCVICWGVLWTFIFRYWGGIRIRNRAKTQGAHFLKAFRGESVRKNYEKQGKTNEPDKLRGSLS